MSDEQVVNGAAKPAEDLNGIDPRFHEVVNTHTRALWVLVFNANMVREALGHLKLLAEKHQSRGGLHALGVISAAFAEQGSQYAKQMEWSQEAIDACARDIMLACQDQRIQLLQ